MTARRPRRRPPDRPALTVVVHGIEQARAACRTASHAGVALELRSAAGAAGYMGPAWFAAMKDEIDSEFPGLAATWVLDCGDAAGYALGALRHGVRVIRFTGRGRARARLAAIARSCGATLAGPARGALDLARARDPEAACRARLGAGNDDF